MRNAKKLSVPEAAEKIADIIQGQLEKLSEAEHAARLRGFHKVVSTVATPRARRAKLPKTRVTRPSARRSE